MTVFRHLKCCDGWVFFLFPCSRREIKNRFSCLLKWKRDSGSILERQLSGEEKEKMVLLSSTKTKEGKILLKLIKKMVLKLIWKCHEFFFLAASCARIRHIERLLLNAEIFWFADGYSSYIINVLSSHVHGLLDSIEVLELLLACKVGIVDYVVEVSDAGINDSSVERWSDACSHWFKLFRC